jgi:hypothetical protein
MPFQIFKPGRADTFVSRMERVRNDAYSRGTFEGKVFKLAVGRDFQREQALDWLSTVIDEGREDLEAQHALEREVEAWDMSCRIAFLVEITPRR